MMDTDPITIATVTANHSTNLCATTSPFILKVLKLKLSTCTFVLNQVVVPRISQFVIPHLKDIGMMDEDDEELSDFINCILHTLNLFYESSCKNTAFLSNQEMTLKLPSN
jgi:hypothetical protein